MLWMVLAGLALSGEKVPDNCRDDRGQDRCSAVQQAKMRALYRVPPIDTYAGSTVRRIFFVDGYGHDTIAIEFIRGEARDPVVRVHFPKVKGQEPDAPIEQLLDAGQWQQVLSASQHFDRQFAPLVAATSKSAGQADGEDVLLCLHSWVYWAESIDPRGKPRSVVHDACGDAPVEQFAWFAAKLSMQAIPFCAALDKKLSRNEATLLRSCSSLTGDRLAAAEAWNRAYGFRSIDTPGGLDDLPAYDLALDFQGKKMSGDEAKAFWRSLMAEQDAPNFYYDRVHGISADQVVVAGGLLKEVGDERYQTAAVELHWEREGGTLQVKSIKVEPYRPITFPSE